MVNMKYLKKEEGFTLIEMMIVVIIIIAIIVLGIGGWRIVQEANRDMQRRALTRDIILALLSFEDKHNGYPTEGISLTQNVDKGIVEICACISAANCNSTCSGGEKVDSKANFLPNPDGARSFDCSGYPATGPELEAEEFEYCYEGAGKAYELNVLLERTDEVYQAGNE
jgi:type II secretory pathway pseudopilin PulG